MAENEENNQTPEGDSGQEKGRNVSKRESGIEEYRLVPLEEARYYDDDEKLIDFVGVARDLYDNRRMIFNIFIVFMLFGTLLFVFKERTYYSETSLMPESRTSGTQITRMLQQYQGILGIQPDGDRRDELSVELYPKIVESLPFQIELLQRDIYFEEYDQRFTFFEYLTEVREKTVMQKAGTLMWNLTFGLPRTIGNLFRASGGGDLPEEIDFAQFRDLETPRVVDPKIRNASREMINWTTVRIEPQTGFIQIGVSMPDPQASAEAVNVVKELLKRYVTEYRTDKAVQDLEYIEGQYEQARVRFEAAQDSLATFLDQNINLATARARMMEQRVQSHYNLAFDVYNSLATRLEEARIKVQEETPVFRIYEPVTIPRRPSEPNALRIFVGSAFLGLFFGVSMVYFRRGFYRFVTDVKNRSSAFRP